MGVRNMMETPCKILILVIFTLTLGEAKDDRDNMIEVKEIIMELKDELAATKDGLAATNDKLVATMEELAATKEELAATNDKLVATNDKLVDTNDKLVATKEEQMATKEELTNVTMTMKDELKMLQKEVTILRDSPFLHMCGSHYDLLSGSKTIPYSKLFYSSTNTEGGGLDITSGVFTSPWGGSYTVTWSTSSWTLSGSGNDIYLYKNSNKVEESRHYSVNYNGAYVSEQGGRTLTLYLAMGDTLHLYCDNCYDIK